MIGAFLTTSASLTRPSPCTSVVTTTPFIVGGIKEMLKDGKLKDRKLKKVGQLGQIF